MQRILENGRVAFVPETDRELDSLLAMCHPTTPVPAKTSNGVHFKSKKKHTYFLNRRSEKVTPERLKEILGMLEQILEPGVSKYKLSTQIGFASPTTVYQNLQTHRMGVRAEEAIRRYYQEWLSKRGSEVDNTAVTS